MEGIRKALNEFANSLILMAKSVTSIINRTLSKKDKKEFLLGPHYTNYRCDKCDCSLVMCKNTANSIYYQCINCGKIHKANKGKILGRFKQ